MKLSTIRLVKHWHRVSREVEDPTLLQPFKVRLNRALSSLILLKMSLLVVGLE